MEARAWKPRILLGIPFPVLLLRVGRGEHPVELRLRQLDAPHERLRSVRRNRRSGAGRVGRRGLKTGPPALGRDARHHRSGQRRWPWYGVVE